MEARDSRLRRRLRTSNGDNGAFAVMVVMVRGGVDGGDRCFDMIHGEI